MKLIDLTQARQAAETHPDPITGIEIQPVHEEAMRQAKQANEAEGIFFPETDPDAW